jgi:hypothetical protein
MDEENKDIDKFVVVSIYEVNQAYGGPEEGGWYYTYGEPYVELAWMAKVFKTQDEAQGYKEMLNLVVETINKQEDRYPPSSVRCDGYLQVIVDYNEWPNSFPKERPHYE